MGVEMISTAHRLTGRPGGGRAAGPRRRRRLGAAAHRRVRRAARGGARRRPCRRRAARRDGRPRPADEVPARPLRAAVRRPIPTRRCSRRSPPMRRSAARALAQRSLVLVENDGVLPLSAGHRRVAVIGPIADSARDLLGDYSHLVHMETLREMRRRASDALGIVGDGRGHRARRRAVRSADDPRRAARVARRMRRSATPAGAASADGDDDGVAAAVDARPRSDVAIVVLGERSGLTDDSTTGEFRDRATLGLPRPTAGAARGGRRHRHAGRPRGRQRPTARDRMRRSRALRRDPARLGARATPVRMRSPTC